MPFIKEGRKCCHFDFGQDFRGWRTCWVPFRDMDGEPEQGMDEIRLSSNVEDGRGQYETVTTLYQHWLGEGTLEKCPAKGGECGPGPMGMEKGNDMYCTEYSGDTTLRLRDPFGNEYVIPAGQHVIVARGMQESRTQDTGKPVSARYEKAWIRHGKAPSEEGYEYMVRIRPGDVSGNTGMSEAAGSEDENRGSYQILQKDESLHAIYDAETGIYAYVFFKACSAPEGGGGMVRNVDLPCLVMERQQGEELHVSFRGKDGAVREVTLCRA